MTVDPEQYGGRPCIRGLCLHVTEVLDLLANGPTAAQVLAAWPDLAREDRQAGCGLPASGSISRWWSPDLLDGCPLIASTSYWGSETWGMAAHAARAMELRDTKALVIWHAQSRRGLPNSCCAAPLRALHRHGAQVGLMEVYHRARELDRVEVYPLPAAEV